MGYNLLKFKFVRKLKPEASKWHFWLKSHRPSFLLFLNCFRANQVGFKQVFDNLTAKHMDALRKQIQSLTDFFFEPLFLDLCNVKEILRMIARNNLL